MAIMTMSLIPFMEMLTRYNLMKNSELLQVGDFLQYYPVGSTNKTYRHDITEIVLKVALNTITPNPMIQICNKLKVGHR
jgi:hypothetical protein